MLRCLLLLFLVGVATPLAGQSLVTGVRDLDFGPVIRGVPAAVSPADPIRSGRFYARHQLNRPVQLRFTLPTQLPKVGGGPGLPITFGATDAIAQGTAPNSLPVVFNPNSPRTFRLVSSADFFVNLGGRVNPTAGQPTGAYRGTVTLTCNFF